MIFHENRQLADKSHEIPHLIFVENYEKFVVCFSFDWRINAPDLTLLVLFAILENNYSVMLGYQY